VLLLVRPPAIEVMSASNRLTLSASFPSRTGISFIRGHVHLRICLHLPSPCAVRRHQSLESIHMACRASPACRRSGSSRRRSGPPGIAPSGWPTRFSHRREHRMEFPDLVAGEPARRALATANAGGINVFNSAEDESLGLVSESMYCRAGKQATFAILQRAKCCSPLQFAI